MNPLTNWKTSLFGLGAGILQLLASGASPKHALSALALAALGIFARDYNVDTSAKN